MRNFNNRSVAWLGVACGTVAALALIVYVPRLRVSGISRHGTVQPDLDVGDVLCGSDGVKLKTNSKGWLVLASSESCGVCRIERPFENELLIGARDLGYTPYAIVGPAPNQDSLVESFRQSGVQVVRANPGSVGASRVPALFVLDKQGKIVSRWIGSVPKSRRQSFLTDLLSGSPLQHYGRISTQELAGLLKEPGPIQLVGLRPPPAPLRRVSEYKVIPINDPIVRANYELDWNVRTFVDCGTATTSYECQAAAFELAAMNFVEVSAVDLPRRSGSCSK
jgi:hypothetical protein